MGSNTANQGLGRATNSKKEKLTSKYNTEPRLINITNSTINTELSGITIISNNNNNNNKKKKEKKKKGKEKENFYYNEREPDLPIVKNSHIPNINFGSEGTISDNEENRPGPSNMTSNVPSIIKRGGRRRPAASENSKHNGTGEPGPSSNPVIRLDSVTTAFEKQKTRSNIDKPSSEGTSSNVTTTKSGKTKKINNDKKNKLANISNLPNKKPGGKASKAVNKKQRTSKNGGKENKKSKKENKEPGKENKEPRKKPRKAKKKNDANYREKLNMDIAVLEQLRNLVKESDLCDYPLDRMIRLESIARPYRMIPPLCILIDLHGCNYVKAQSLLTAFQSLEPSLKHTPRVRFVTGSASTRENPPVLRPLVAKFLNKTFPSRQKWEYAAFIDLEILGEENKKMHKADGKESRVQQNDNKSNGDDKGTTSENKEPNVFEPQIEKTSIQLAMDTADPKDAKRENVKKNLKSLAMLVRRICKFTARKFRSGDS